MCGARGHPDGTTGRRCLLSLRSGLPMAGADGRSRRRRSGRRPGSGDRPRLARAPVRCDAPGGGAHRGIRAPSRSLVARARAGPASERASQLPHGARRHPQVRPDRCSGRPPSRQPDGARLLGGVPGLVERWPPGPGSGRCPVVVPSQPARRRASARAAVGRSPIRERGRRRRVDRPGGSGLGHDLDRRPRARPRLVHRPRSDHAPAVRGAGPRVPRPGRHGGALRGVERSPRSRSSNGTRRWPWCGARPS